MESCTLSGRSILIAEDEPLIALDIAEAFKRVGAAIVVTSTVQHALVLVEHDDLSAYRGRAPTAKAKTNEIKVLAKAGLGPTEIARRLDVGRSSVYRALSNSA
jgi:hypothetical protein